ncbi:LuxR C-terminal-related transcriptional regulator [Crossiella cryophila]|uniref:DNA-binding CsgD family transcriptional regulator n=1 Tax=Crossiella cryophila TaxID=43355 RepID=A0A7W7CG22_9PSEU|nr:LuxR C-terminal-related transcriptional regulator [Crossiella cryophila]MBB4678844.1 DNA-binding CsgD family transcriptional regulator [Crossiella cryophila]
MTAHDRTPALSATRARILEGIAAGATSQRLAARLHLSVRGVEYHLAAMQRAFAASNRVTLVARAYAAGVLVAGSWPPRVAEEVAEPEAS